MTDEKLQEIKAEIKYLYLLGHGNFDPQVVELMKLAALYDVQKRFEAGEEW
jgi:hypothetical protein